MQRIAEARITRMMGVPTMFGAMAQLPTFDDADVSSVRTFLVGAAPVPAALVERYQTRGAHGFTNAYGLTEGGGFNLFLPAEQVVAHPGAYRPALYTDARVIDADGRDVTPEETGELLLRGPSIMRGYWHNDEASADALHDGWLRTGDVVRVSGDGYLYPIDRVKDMVISGGLNVYPAEVEIPLFGHPSLVDVTVIGLPDSRWGEAVTVVAVAKADEQVTAQEIIAFCDDKLADYKRPKDVIFVDEIPRNTGGKVLKRELRERFAQHYGVSA
jgi:fatty-acyl-CoA synthase